MFYVDLISLDKFVYVIFQRIWNSERRIKNVGSIFTETLHLFHFGVFIQVFKGNFKV